MRRWVAMAVAAAALATGRGAHAQHCDGLAHISVERGGSDLKIYVVNDARAKFTAELVWKNLPAGSTPSGGIKQVSLNMTNLGPLTLSKLASGTRLSSIGPMVDFKASNYNQPYVTLNDCKRQ